jgi:acid phosphatase
MRKTTGRPCLLAALGAVLSITLAAACAHTSDARSGTAPERAAEPSIEAGIDNLNAVLWVQTSVEYRANSLQAYALAGRLLDDALADPRWTAALEQTGGDYRDLPPAVIVDVDETVLDNSY